MRVLLLSGNNTLSHIGKCLALRERLSEHGHEILIAVSRDRSRFLEASGFPYVILPDIQEADHAPLPTFRWFRDPLRIVECIRAEVALMRDFRPDRVIGVFRFTGKVSAWVAGVPYDSLICGCMIPVHNEVLGFADGEPGIREQREYLDNFYRFAASRMNAAVKEFRPEKIHDVRHVLMGERTFLWDFCEFMPLPKRPDTIHVGPIIWNKWMSDDIDFRRLSTNGRPLSVVSFGTGLFPVQAALRIIRILLGMGYTVVFIAGGHPELLAAVPRDPHVIPLPFFPLSKVLPRASLLVCHGGQNSIFEALLNKVPVVVLPSHPEQAHNGLCLERIGCGRRLVPPRPFRGDPHVYLESLQCMSDGDIESAIGGLTRNPETAWKLDRVRPVIAGYEGVDKLARMIGE